MAVGYLIELPFRARASLPSSINLYKCWLKVCLALKLRRMAEQSLLGSWLLPPMCLPFCFPKAVVLLELVVYHRMVVCIVEVFVIDLVLFVTHEMQMLLGQARGCQKALLVISTATPATSGALLLCGFMLLKSRILNVS